MISQPSEKQNIYARTLKNAARQVLPVRVREDFQKRMVEVMPSRLLFQFERASGFLVPECYRNFDLVFIHVPKAAGTSISNALYGVDVPHYTMQHYLKVDPFFFSQVPSFAVVRNPFERVFSAYRFLVQGGTRDVDVRYASRYEKFKSFADFLMFLYDHQDEVLMGDYVLRRQGEFILDRNLNPAVNMIFDVCELDKCKEYLGAVLGRNVDFGVHNSTGGKENYKSYYNSRLIDVAFELYRRDFEHISVLSKYNPDNNF
jgi:chondroitin 4-sulfotransferase 11